MKHHNAGRQGRTFINRSADAGIPPPPPDDPDNPEAGGVGKDAAEGDGPGADESLPEGTRPPAVGGGHRAAMGAPAITMER